MIYLSHVEYVIHKFLSGICVVSSIRKIVSRVFFQEHTHPLIETSSRGSCNLQEFDLDNLFLYLRSLFINKPSKAYLKHPL